MHLSSAAVNAHSSADLPISRRERRSRSVFVLHALGAAAHCVPSGAMNIVGSRFACGGEAERDRSPSPNARSDVARLDFGCARKNKWMQWFAMEIHIS